MRRILFAATVVASTLFADFRGWTMGSLMPWSSARRYGSSYNHK